MRRALRSAGVTEPCAVATVDSFQVITRCTVLCYGRLLGLAKCWTVRMAARPDLLVMRCVKRPTLFDMKYINIIYCYHYMYM